jgi:hypothetical protein
MVADQQRAAPGALEGGHAVVRAGDRRAVVQRVGPHPGERRVTEAGGQVEHAGRVGHQRPVAGNAGTGGSTGWGTEHAGERAGEGQDAGGTSPGAEQE